MKLQRTHQRVKFNLILLTFLVVRYSRNKIIFLFCIYLLNSLLLFVYKLKPIFQFLLFIFLFRTNWACDSVLNTNLKFDLIQNNKRNNNKINCIYNAEITWFSFCKYQFTLIVQYQLKNFIFENLQLTRLLKRLLSQ